MFHSLPDRTTFDDKSWGAYKKSNEKFAEITIQNLKRVIEKDPDSVPMIWIHDFHLLLAANTIRQIADEENLQCKIGFYLHVPFPTWDMIKICPWFDTILQGILGCDMIGLLTRDYCLNFIDACERGLKSRVDRDSLLVEHGSRAVRIRSLPIGILFSKFEDMAKIAPQCKFSCQSWQ